MKKTKLIILAGIVLVLNLIWEFSHYRLYIDLTGIPSTTHLILASFTDLLIIGGIFAVNSSLNKNWKWIEKPDKSDYAFVVVFCLLVAIIIEKHALAVGKWIYTDSMPLIFGIGLSPLVQLLTTSMISLFIARKLFFKDSRN